MKIFMVAIMAVLIPLVFLQCKDLAMALKERERLGWDKLWERKK